MKRPKKNGNGNGAKAEIVKAARTSPPVHDGYKRPTFERSVTRFDAATVEQILEHLRDGAQLVSAFELARVGKHALRGWLKRAKEGDPELTAFFHEVAFAAAQAERKRVLLLELAARGRKIQEKVRDANGNEVTREYKPDPMTARFLLQHGPTRERWMTVERSEHVGKGGGPIATVSRFAGWTDAQLEFYAKHRRPPPELETSPAAEEEEIDVETELGEYVR